MRIGFVDEMGERGEVNLSAVRPGDRIKFLEAFTKLVGPKGKLHVSQGALGEVHGIGQEVLEVLVPAHRTQGADMFAEEVQLEVRVEQVQLVVDSRDPRISSHRIGGLSAGGPFSSPPGLRTGAVRFRAADKPRIEQALWAMGPDFMRAHGHKPEPKKRRDVVWCLKALAQRLRAKTEDEEPTPELVDQGEGQMVLREKPAPENAAPQKAEADAIDSLADNLTQAGHADWLQLLDVFSQDAYSSGGPSSLAPGSEAQPETHGEEPEAGAAGPAAAEPVRPGEPVPVKMAPGAGSMRAYSDPGLEVYSTSRKLRGVVVGNQQPDLLIVKLPDGSTQAWDAMDVRVDARNSARPRTVSPEDFTAWMASRRRRVRGVLLAWAQTGLGDDQAGVHA